MHHEILSAQGTRVPSHHSQPEEIQCRGRIKSCPLLLVLCYGKSSPYIPFRI